MAPPIRVQMKRRKGEVVYPYDFYAGRTCYRGGWELPTSIFANPYPIGKKYNREESLRLYRERLLQREELLEQLPILAGKRVGCFCPLEEKGCHVEVLIEVGRDKNLW
jgi:uncharacterized protein DUF4326